MVPIEGSVEMSHSENILSPRGNGNLLIETLGIGGT